MAKFDHSGLLLRFAVGSRILLLALILLSRSMFSPYDTSASINPTCLSPNSPDPAARSVLFPSIGSAIEETIVWDSVYFLRIAQCGYEYEQTYAFLPLLPIAISLLSNSVFRPLVPLIGYRAVLGLSGYVINNVAFLFAALYFYRLSLAVLMDPEASLRASVLFCLNPASIFYSSIYSESLYALFSVGGLYHLVSGAKTLSVPWLALSGSARSNGLLNAGYLCYQTMHQSFNAFFAKKRVLMTIQILVAGLLQCIYISVPFIAFQAYGYYNLCNRQRTEPARPWCNARVPLLYNFIQSHYWDVGFLRYFQLKQLPNFLLASPILSLAVCSIYSYAKSAHKNFVTLGFSAAVEEQHPGDMFFAEDHDITRDVSEASRRQVFRTGNLNLRKRRSDISARRSAYGGESRTISVSGYYSVAVLPFIYHLGFLVLASFFVMHVQVSTRFLSSNPPLYWFAAYLMDSPRCRKWGYLIWAYSATYIFLGSLLFSNFYPFT